ncbi:MAG: hypothetical protein JSV23_04480 [Promethearchaeota archaeon]|nr:MAG: hypothetical protein JSV23_04480 [Candidatus Lokiarchaeota archaeon]
MIKLFEIRNKKRACSICNDYVESHKIHVVIEIHTVPPSLLFFHFEHYKCFLDTLSNYFEEINDGKFENFMNQPIFEIEQEQKMAKDQGFEIEFENDLNEVRNFLVYEGIRKTLKTEFICSIFKNKTNIEECFKCEWGKLLLCDKCIIFSIKAKTRNFIIKKKI